MAGLLDNAPVAIRCSKCGHKTNKSVGWIKNNREFTCSCGTIVCLDQEDFKSKITELDKSFEDFQNILKTLNK
jgi:DNA-directed RNA polymerase subunit N (RpoN/RPB10)